MIAKNQRPRAGDTGSSRVRSGVTSKRSESSSSNHPPQVPVAAAIAAALQRFPDLNVGGIGLGLAGPEIYSRPWREDQIETARAFLRECRPRRFETRSSYLLKHIAEDWGPSAGFCSHVCNAAMIAAAVALGFQIEPYSNDDGNPNAEIGISHADVEPLAKAAHEYWHPPKPKPVEPEPKADPSNAFLVSLLRLCPRPTDGLEPWTLAELTDELGWTAKWFADVAGLAKRLGLIGPPHLRHPTVDHQRHGNPQHQQNRRRLKRRPPARWTENRWKRS